MYIVANRMVAAEGRSIHQWGKLQEDSSGVNDSWDGERDSKLYAIESGSTSWAESVNPDLSGSVQMTGYAIGPQ